MSFKNLIKKVALVAGSVALLATAGGVVSANAMTAQQVGQYENKVGSGSDEGEVVPSVSDPNNVRVGKYHHTYGHNGYIDYRVPGSNETYSAYNHSPLFKELMNHNNGNSKNSTANDSSNANSSASENDNNGNANDYNADGSYNYANEDNGSDATQSGNKLVQTGENNGAEYAAFAGVVLTASAVAFAGYDLMKKNA